MSRLRGIKRRGRSCRLSNAGPLVLAQETVGADWQWYLRCAKLQKRLAAWAVEPWEIEIVRLVLEVQGGSSTRRRVEVESGRSLSIGRTPRADLVFAEDTHMSGLHCVFVCDERGALVRDLNSSNGTLLNGIRVGTAPLKDGDVITAGSTSLGVGLMDERLASSAPATQSTAEPEAISPKARLLHLLREEFQPLYALLDAAIEPEVLKVIFESGEAYQSLFDGPSGAQLTHFAPYLMRVPKDSPVMEKLVDKGWGKSWGVYLTCDWPLPELRNFLRQFLMVNLPDGKQVFFRFYDPRVLRLYLPLCTLQEANEFFGPLKYYLIEDDKGETLLRFSNKGVGVGRKEISLVMQPPGEDTAQTVIQNQ